MLRKKLREIQKDNSINSNRDITNINKYQTIKDINPNINYKKIEKKLKNNLPELRLSKIKSRIESEINSTYKSINQSNINIKNISDIQNKKKNINNKIKNNSLTKKNDVVFPKITNSLKNNNNKYIQYEKYNNDFNDNNCSISNEYNQNTINNSHFILNNLQHKAKKEIGNNNNISELHKIKQKKVKKVCFSQVNLKNRNLNLDNENKFQHHLLLQSIPKTNISHVSIPILNLSSSSNNIHLEKIEKDTNNINIENNILNNNNINNINNSKTLQTKTIKQSSSFKNMNFMANELKELDNISEKLNKINIKLNKLSPLSSISTSPIINKNSILSNLYLEQPSKPINITSEILKKSFPNFEESITSYYSDFSSNPNLLIKGYAYNTSKGNIRNYNEDTITIEKIKLNKNNNDDFFYFFGIYDGHGGNGCSYYLKQNLHNFIKEFSIKGIKDAIYESENEFLTKIAIDEKNNILDSSGSCGIIAMIKNNKLIISNTGDSRIVIYKNGKIFFVTEDHKPCYEKEKERIKNAGGQIYQSPSIIPIYQNGKRVELPWRVLPGRLSVSRTFGDIEAKNEKFGGKKGVIVPTPDISEIELNNEFDFMVIGCDGIFDVVSNEELFDIWNIVLNENKNNFYKNIEKNNEIDTDNLCGDFAGLIIKSALAKNSYDNVSCIVIVFNINNYNNISIKEDENNNNKNTIESNIKEVTEEEKEV